MTGAKTYQETSMNMRAYLPGFGLLIVLASFAFAQNNSAPAGAGTSKPSQLQELVLANQILANEGVLDAYGHVSIRDERNPNQYLLARAIAAGTVTASDIITYDLDSNPIGDNRPGFSERFIHGQIYKARPDVMAVVHFHAPEVIPFTVTPIALRPMIHMAGFLPQVMPIFEIRKAGGITDMLVRSNELGKALADTLADKSVVLLRGHGAAVAAPSLHIATGRAYYTVSNARAQAQAMLLAGDKITFLDPEEAKKAGDQDAFERGWNYWKYKVEK
jgi:HCOMODA/2-hydroxy-3-carboxy-muconic semialdehyde decarboxylase